jgi:DNA-binding MarR family transcriptional regulator
MMAAARRGWLYGENGKFGLTDEGREVVEGIYELGDRLYAKIKALTGPEMSRLLSLSDRVLRTIKKLPDPAERPAFELSLLFDRGVDTPPIVQVRQRILVLLAFREDAHVAAWRPYEPDGQLWEALTLIWRERASDAAELAEQLPHRNYAKSDYVSALEKLSARGWITVRGGRFVIQEQAARMRQEVEEVTDRTFAAAFADLNPAEMREFRELMGKLAAAVTLQESGVN